MAVCVIRTSVTNDNPCIKYLERSGPNGRGDCLAPFSAQCGSLKVPCSSAQQR